ncbi:hypothetical protein [Streptomyces sioyaensis]|uniref:hypothetical protein n=1 Tax=Streptomyces sioyaensis TaxID=67364 RepID=UPI003797A994
MTAASTHVPQALADEIASIGKDGIPADDNHKAMQAHWVDPLDKALSQQPPNYGPASETA